MNGEEVRAIIEKSLNCKMDEIFAEFDDEVLGAASIGQVHKARLKNGQVVAVKVKYPSAEGLFAMDMSTMKQFSALAQPEQVPILDELERQFMSEFDFRKEAETLDEIGKNIHPFFKNIAIPKPIKNLCSSEVVTMEFFEGKKLVDEVTEQYKAIAASMGVTLEELQNMKEPTADTKKISFWTGAYMAGKYLASTGYRMVATPTVSLYNSSIGYLTGHKLNPPKQPINSRKLVETLVHAHAHQIFVNGFFNGTYS